MYLSGSLVQMIGESDSMGDSESKPNAVGAEKSKPLHDFEFPQLKRGPLKFKLRTEDGMFHLQTETDKLKAEGFRKKATEENENREEEPEPPQTEAAGVRPWNLRSTKKAGLITPIGGESERELKDENIPNSSSLRTDNGTKLPRLKIKFGNKEKTKFSVALSWKEIEEDVMKMTGEIPPRRSKKRPRAVQKQLDVS